MVHFVLLCWVALVSYRLVFADEQCTSWNKLVHWLHEHQTKGLENFSGVVQEHQGVLMSKDITPNSTLLEIPVELVLWSGRGSTEPKVQGYFDRVSGFQRLVAMVYLEASQSERSKFLPFLDSLPHNPAEVPVFWTDEEIRALQDDRVWTHRERQLQVLEHEYSDLISVTPNLEHSKSTYRWAYSIVSSQAMEFANDTFALIPLSMSFEHGSTSACTWQMDSSHRAFKLQAATNGHRRGEPVRVAPVHKDHSNYRLLTQTGHLQGQLRRENVEIFALPPQIHLLDPGLDLKRKEILFRDHPFYFPPSYKDREQGWFPFHYQVNLVQVMWYFRVLDAQEFHELGFVNRPTDFVSEYEAAQKCTWTMRKFLKQLPTTIAQDYRELNQAQEGSVLYRAIQYRLERKIVFERTKTACEQTLSRLLCLTTRSLRSPKDLFRSRFSGSF